MKRPCPYCDGGCSECDWTGERWTTGIVTPAGATVVAHGSAEMSAEAQAALAQIVDAAFARMDGTGREIHGFDGDDS